MQQKQIIRSRLILLIFWAGLTTIPQTQAQTPLYSAPLALVEQLMFIKLRVNDSRPLNFLLDTGAGVTVINETTADRLELDISARSRIKTAGKTLLAATSAANTLHFGDLTLENISLEIIRLDHLSELLSYPVDGIIGVDLLRQFVLETDIDGQTFNLYDREKHFYQGPGETLELLEMEYGHFGAMVSLDLGPRYRDVSLALKFDTGYSGHLLLDNNIVKRYELIRENRRYHEVESFSADSTININYKKKLKRITLAGKTLRNIPSVLTVDQRNIRAAEKNLSQGLIGQEVLLNFNIIYDYHRRLIHLEPR
ncbi:retropepsin-like aspartic protease [Flavilitoribacter nigricans]|uniref:Peptidase A2 domain-containing protein n=1 Tax=Flavilitoribacter nigricans (strain ATCC 23147 / DSM 23189 / NBRC 102662 / NCIMB 1420 / SS-2) TaxID=1122177 RepID=A0A2D0MY89_FLAN2|nr:retropepsin-like aspartic protease [Flavilitoribacter nigricans]PHN01215.1 hypothetical protein CRP01_38390 [Flavilitoribacter nigricans DSM 23189 = NBRC 102662]